MAGSSGRSNAPGDRAANLAASRAWSLPPFVDLRHTVGTYPMPEGDLRTLLDATMVCTDLVLVTPVYWYSFPSSLKTYLDHWSAWLRVPGLVSGRDGAGSACM